MIILPTDEIGRAEMHVLIAEDDDFQLQLYARIVRQAGHTCELAINGEKAIQLLHNQRFDAIITDTRMPKESGLSVIRQVWAHEYKIPVLIHSDANALRENGKTIILSELNDVYPFVTFRRKQIFDNEIEKYLLSFLEGI